ncbi:MAG TPA: AraC family transcriptional regulator [Firmicutes bacterium]|nr:AraC family transcriptional regulator [Bacillota bacterium]
MQIDHEYLCNVIGNLSGIPIRVYKDGQRTFYNSLVRLPADPLKLYEKEVLAIKAHIGYFITPSFHYYGVVGDEHIRIVIGPAVQTRSTDSELRKLAFECDVPSDEVSEFVAAMNSIVHMPLESILQILCTINYIMNGEKLGLRDITIYDAEQENLKAKLEAERSEQLFRTQSADAEYAQYTHNTLAVEQTILNYVRLGDTAALQTWLSDAPAARAGILADGQIRQSKNTFIVTATLVSRAAIRGGMDIDDAFSLSDAYIQKCELSDSVQKITNLQYRMVLDYTERVEKLRRGGHPSKFVLDVTNFILHHISEPVTTEEIAKALFMSRSRLSVKFKKETGENLIDFILKQKTEEAKRLLRYTDKPLIAIGNYLAFSSQSHFSRIFKQYCGCTPNEYRKRYNSTL